MAWSRIARPRSSSSSVMAWGGPMRKTPPRPRMAVMFVDRPSSKQRPVIAAPSSGGFFVVLSVTTSRPTSSPRPRTERACNSSGHGAPTGGDAGNRTRVQGFAVPVSDGGLPRSGPKPTRSTVRKGAGRARRAEQWRPVTVDHEEPDGRSVSDIAGWSRCLTCCRHGGAATAAGPQTAQLQNLPSTRHRLGLGAVAGARIIRRGCASRSP